MSLGPRVYGLSFEPLSEQRCPRVILEIPKRYAASVERAIQCEVMQEQPRAKARRYLHTQAPHFYLDGRSSGTPLGYLACGSRYETADSVCFGLDLLKPETAPALALTVEVLLHECERMRWTESQQPGKSNQLQHMSLEGGAVFENGCLKRHALVGSVSASVGRWLLQLAHSVPPDNEAKGYSPEFFIGWPFPEESVCQAMNLAYKHLVKGPRIKDACAVGLKRSGKLALVGLGTNLAMFPDVAPQPDTDTGNPVQLDCWNMDGASQLLVMLAGMAALHDVIARDLG